MKRIAGIAALTLVALLLMPAGREAVGSPGGDTFTITVDNRALNSVKVYSIHAGTAVRLGTVRPYTVERLRARCADFRAAETDFVLREIPGRPFRLEGVSIFDCEQEIRIDVLPIGVEFSRIWILPRDGA